MRIILFIFRYDEIEGKMTPFLKSSGYNVKKGISSRDGGSFFILTLEHSIIVALMSNEFR
jgi:hypothetical protein